MNLRNHICHCIIAIVLGGLLFSCETMPALGLPAVYIRVYNSEGNPIQFAEVIYNNTLRIAVTDEYGRVAIVRESPGFPEKIEIRHPDYLPLQREIVDEVIFITLQKRETLLSRSYQLAKTRKYEEALKLLIENKGFTPENDQEHFYLAILFYLNKQFARSLEVIEAIQGDEAKRRLIALIRKQQEKLP